MQFDTEKNGVQLFCTPVNDHDWFIVTRVKGPGATADVIESAYELLTDTLSQLNAIPVQERIFTDLRWVDTIKTTREDALKARSISAGPCTFIDGKPPWGPEYAGTIVRAVSRTSVKDLRVNDVTDSCAGISRWVDGMSEYILIQGLHGLEDGANNSREAQTARIFARAEALLNDADATYQDVVRTWFYLNEVLAWYGPFNKVRNTAYDDFGIMPKKGDTKLKLPASTGIGGKGLQNAAAMVDVLAMKTHSGDEVKIHQLCNAGQQDAFQYGSAFSRGAHIALDGASIIELSGTASINETGETIYIDDTEAQIECTFDKISQLLEPEGLSCQDFAAACVFIKNADDFVLYQQIEAAKKLKRFPAVYVQADVCRDDLLFEIDGELIIPTE